MRNLLRKPWFAVVLAVIAIALVVRSLSGNSFGFSTPAAASPDSAIAGADPAQAPAGPAESVGRILAELPPPSRVHDPFALPSHGNRSAARSAAPEQVDRVHISALWSEGVQTLALINGQVCGRGDRIGRIEISDLNQEGVWVNHAQGRTFIPLGGDFTLRAPAE
jgi:hypothetical protein